MRLIKAMWLSAIVVVVALTTVQCSDDVSDAVSRRFEKLKLLGDSVGWKPKIEPPEEELRAVERKAHIYTESDFDVDLRGKAPCPTGYTGINCNNPICYNTSIIDHHDGTDGYGDDIEWDVSPACNGTFLFPLDIYTGDIYMSILASKGANPTGVLTGPKGNEIFPCQNLGNGDSQWQVKYCTVIQHNGAGTYTFQVKSSITVSCIYSVQGVTDLATDGGFVSDPRDDNVQVVPAQGNSGIQRDPLEGVPSYLAFALTIQRPPVHAESVTFYRNGAYFDTLAVNTRYHCGAPNFVGPFTCSQLGFYHVKIRGLDLDGNIWQRVYYFNCLPGGTVTRPTGTPPTFPPPTECYNGGNLQEGGTPDAFCYCLPFFTGNKCQQKLCFNDGVLTANEDCRCQIGFSGTYCQDVQCSNSNAGQFGLQSRALVFVVRTSASMQSAFQQIVDAAKRITDYYATTDPDYYRMFVLATFVNGTIPAIRQSENAARFIEDLTRMVATPAGCDDAVFTTLSATLQIPALQNFLRSPIFIFTDAVPHDDNQYIETLLHQLSFWRGQVYTIVTDPGNGCTIDTVQPGYQAYRFLSRFTQGHVSYVQKTTISALTFNIASNIYQMDFVMTNDLMVNCQAAPMYQPFFVDTNTSYIVITATGSSLTLSITDPMLSQRQMVPIYSQNETYIWKINNPLIGSYLLSLTGGRAPCQYRVMARSSLDLFFGISDNLNADAIGPQPVFRTDSHIVAHINNLGFRTNTGRIHAEVTITNNDEADNRVALYASNGIYRDRCSYALYFGDWKCTRPFEQFYVTIYATDNLGATVQRTATAFCSATPPTHSSPNGCQNGGVDGPNGTCFCQPYFSGPKCQQIRCLNGGTITSGVCFCPPGFTGQFCEQVTCYKSNPDADRLFSPNDRSLTYIIHDSLFMRPVIQGLAKTAALLIQDISQQHPFWIRHFQVISFDDKGIKVYKESNDPNDFIAGLQQLSADNTAGTGYSCKNLTMLPAINRALSSLGISRYGYVFVFTNGQAAMNITTLGYTFDVLEQTKAQINFIQTFSRPCGGQLTDPGASVQLELPAFSGGDFFLLSVTRAAAINNYVPTLYSGNYVYENYITDCTVPQSFYFPVDSHTQAFTIYTYGQLANTGNSLLTPRGTQLESQYMVNLWTDTSMNTRVDQIIRPCDPGWDDVLADGYCYKFNFQQLNWTQARDVCHGEGAVLATIFDAGFENILEGQAPSTDFWIGLNDIAQEGVFVWDQLNGSLPLSPGMFTKWAQGQPAPDPNHLTNCVIEQLSQNPTGWVPIACSTPKLSVCIKKNYKYDYEPQSDTQNDLPKGIWTLGVQTQSGPCYVKVYSQSQIQLYHQFIVNIHDDVGEEAALRNTNTNRMIAHVTHQESSSVGLEGELQYLHLYKQNLTLQDVETFSARGSCAFEYLSTPFTCPAFNFNAMVTGIDSFGYLYQRIKPIFCLSGVSSGSCQHGGAFSNGFCFCQQYWTGRYCQTPVCTNGGVLDAGAVMCRCPRGWTGTFCELPVCNPIVPAAHRSNDNRTFVLVLDGTMAGIMTPILTNIQATLTTLLTNVAMTYPAWFSRYVGVVFFDPTALPGRNVTSATVTATTIADFATQIAAALQPPFNSVPGQCPRSALSGLVQALNSPQIGYRDEVFVLTASTASDWILEGQALDAITSTHSYVSFIMLGDAFPCGASLSDPGFEAYFNLAEISGGGIYQFSPDKLMPFWSSLLSTYYGSSWLSFRNYQNCANITHYAQAGINSTIITVDIYSVDPPTLNIIDTNRTNLTPSFTFGSTHTNVAQFGVVGQPGIYTMQINQNSVTEFGKPCLVKVRGQSFVNIYFGFTQDVGIEHGVHSDQVSVAPVGRVGVVLTVEQGKYKEARLILKRKVKDMANALVANSNDVGLLTYVQFLSLTDSALLWSSPLQMRSGCAFLYISSIFYCPADSFAVAIDGTDFEGHPIRSITNVHCRGRPPPTLFPTSPTTAGPTTTTSPTTPPPSTTTVTLPSTSPLPHCDLKSVAADLVVLFDASSGLPPDDYKGIIVDFLPLANQVTIGGNYVRAAMGSYDMMTHFNGDFLSLNSSTDYFDKVVRLWQQPQTGIYGNNIDDALQSIMNLTTTDHGYRVGGNVTDMIVIISSTGWDQGQGFPNPQQSAMTLRKAGFNIVAIGFGPNANMGQLLQISPCAQYAPNLATFSSLIPWIWSRFCLGSTQFC